MSEVTEPYSAAAVTDDSCITRYIEIVPLTRDADDPGITEYDINGEDWLADVKQEMLQDIKQEPDDEFYTRDTDDPGTTECDGAEDWLTDVKQEDMQEDDVCSVVTILTSVQYTM